MKKLILGATGSIGSSLAKKVIADGGEVHLVGRDKSSLSELASELNSTFTTCDVLEEDFSNKIFSDLGETQINGLAYCVGSIDLKPIKMTKNIAQMRLGKVLMPDNKNLKGIAIESLCKFLEANEASGKLMINPKPVETKAIFNVSTIPI